MGWASCGEDSKGRPIGYAHEATCDHPGCIKEIDRGLSFACGGMHGELELGCEEYCCAEHMHFVSIEGHDHIRQLCARCYKILKHLEGDDAVIRIPDDWSWPSLAHSAGADPA